jgi:hypothetical protein
MKKIIMVLIAFVIAATVWATTLTCSIDDYSLIWTGKTKTDRATAQLLYQHKCVNNHYFWLTFEQMSE